MTPIRRTTARLALTGAVALGSVGLLAGAAIAQQVYPPGIQINVVTPGANITVEGGDWGERTTVTIVRVDRDDAAGSTATQPTTAQVADDGTFEAEVTIPEDAEPGSELTYLISGVDAQGNERTEERVLEVQLTSAEMEADAADELAAPLPADDGDSTGLVLASAAGVAAVAGGVAFARRRSVRA